MRTFWIGLAVLVACSDSDNNALSGTWQIKQPAGWTDFRFTLNQGTCTGPSAAYPCDGIIAGSATSNPLVCQVPGMTALSKGQVGYTCDMVFPVTGSVVADDVALNLGVYSDGAKVDLSGRVAADGSIAGELVFTDPTGVAHTIGACPPDPVCLDKPGDVQFLPGGATVTP